MKSALEENKKLVRSIVEDVWNDWRADLIPQLIAPDYVVYRDPNDPWDGKTIGHAEFRERLEFTRNAFPDHHFAIEDLIAEGTRVAVRWTYTGTHMGDINGFAATGRAFRVPGMTVYEITNGHATGHWQSLDRLHLMQQLGYEGG